MLAARVAKLVALRRSERASRKVAIVLFNFPPNAGTTGTAAYLGVFASLLNTLRAMREEGYTVEVPDSVDALREMVIDGNRERLRHHRQCRTPASAPTTSCAASALAGRDRGRMGPGAGPAADRRRATSSCSARSFGNVFVGVQPAFGYEGDPMRLLFEQGFAPTHAFTAFYRWIREDFGAHAVLHFGTHGALEFMPGKQAGLSGQCWPDRLIGDLPEHLPLCRQQPVRGHDRQAPRGRDAGQLPDAAGGPGRPLSRAARPEGHASSAGAGWSPMPRSAARRAGRADPGAGGRGRTWRPPSRSGARPRRPRSTRCGRALLELEYTLIPHGLHVVGEPPNPEQRAEMLDAAGVTDPADRASRRAARHRSRAAGDPARARWPLHPPGAGRRPAAQPATSCRRGATSTASTPSASRAPSRCRTAPARRSGCSTRHAADGNGLPGDGRDGAVGHRQPEDRGRADRAGAGADRRRAALRQLRPPGGRRAAAARRARPAAHRRGRDAVRHLPRPAAAADRSCSPRPRCSPPPPTSRSSRTSSASMRSRIMARAWLRLETGGAARLLQCRRRLWLERQPAGRRAARWNDEDELAEAYRRRKGFAYGRERRSRRGRPRC